MRSYNRKGGVFGGIPVSKSVYQGGIGAWEAYVRYSDTDLQGGSIDGGQMQIITAGLNWWLTSFFAVSVGYKYIDSEIDGLEAATSGALARFTLILQ
jgi:phosphate-selective porin OprO/OprP